MESLALVDKIKTDSLYSIYISLLIKIGFDIFDARNIITNVESKLRTRDLQLLYAPMDENQETEIQIIDQIVSEELAIFIKKS